MAKCHVLNDNPDNLALAIEACTGRDVQWITFSGMNDKPPIPVSFFMDFPSRTTTGPTPPLKGTTCAVVKAIPHGWFNWTYMLRLFLKVADSEGVDVYLLVDGLPKSEERSGTIEEVLDTTKN